MSRSVRRSGTPRESTARIALGLCALLVAAGAAVRAMPLAGDLWLDEIWTAFIARDLGSPLEVFSAVHHSNNHHLNTLFFWILGPDADGWVHRLPSFVFGSASVALAGAIGWRRGALEAVFATLLAAACYVSIHFASEARGYAAAVFFALAAHLALEAALASRRPAATALFAVCAVLGLLSHLIFLFFQAGALAQSGWRLLAAPGSRRAGTFRLLALHGAPLLAFAALWWVDLRHLAVGGGNRTDAALLFAELFGYGFGLPVVPGLAVLYVPLGAAVLALGLRLLWRAGDDAWLLHLVTIAVAPVAALAVFRPEVVAVRYFVIGIAFGLLLGAFLLAELFRRGAPGRALALAVVAVFTVGSARHTAPFLEHGRGDYRGALRFMAEHTEGSDVAVGSDHDFRNGLVLRYYRRDLPPGKTLRYHPRDRRPAGGPEWWVVHRAAAGALPADTLQHGRRRYALAADFPHAGLSGFSWAVYRRE